MGRQRIDDGVKGADGTAAFLFTAMTVMLDGWLLGHVWAGCLRMTDEGFRPWDPGLHQAWKAALTQTLTLGVVVLAGATLGALRSGGPTTRTRRWRNTALGALLAHVLIPLLVIAFFLLHPPPFVF